IKQCPDYGVTSLKLFMAYKGVLQVDDATLFRAMQQAAEHGLLIMVHAQNGDAIDILVKEAVAAGNLAPKYHALTRPPERDAGAACRASRLPAGAGSPRYVVHLTNNGGLEAVRLARARGLSNQIFAETCVQSFFFPKGGLARPGFEGAKWVCSPPYR